MGIFTTNGISRLQGCNGASFFRDCCVVAPFIFKRVVRLHRQAIRPRSAQARLALTKKFSTGGLVYG